MDFIDQLAALRARRRLSLAAIGAAIGMAVPNLSSVLRGRGDTKSSTLASIASALDAEWVLVPKEHLPEVRAAIESDSGDNGAPPLDTTRRTIEISSGKKE